MACQGKFTLKSDDLMLKNTHQDETKDHYYMSRAYVSDSIREDTGFYDKTSHDVKNQKEQVKRYNINNRHPDTEITEDDETTYNRNSSFISDTKDIDEDKSNSEENNKEETHNVSIEHIEKQFMYDVHETPPIHLTIMFALQQCFLSLSRSLSAALFVADIVCARDDEALKARLLSTTFFMSGLCTFLQNTIGIRIPLYQGPAMSYIVPLLALSALKEWQCPEANAVMFNVTNVTMPTLPESQSYHKLREFTGSLMIAGFIHMVIGMTGLVGFLIRFIGPVTVVPSLTVVGLYSYRATVGFASANWGIAFMTAGTTIILSLYLRKINTPIPVWTPKGGCRVIRFPFHKVFSVLISAIFGWVVSIIITEVGGFSNDPKSKEFYARTDSRTYVIDMANWFLFPYPGQFGSPLFNTGAFITFLFGTIASVIDSIGDYYACARVCDLPAPPPHSVNRGIMIEGISSFIAGSAGASHATSTFGGNIGAIGITKVASLRVFQVLGIIYMIFGVIGKIGAVCVTIPYSVIGGMQMINFGVLVGVMISNIQFTDMTSTRNHVIIGFSMFVGLMMPYWMRENPDALDTGNTELNNLIRMILGNPFIVTGLLSCFLDNTVPGTRDERGLTAWEEKELTIAEKEQISVRDRLAAETYELNFLPKSITHNMFARYSPFCPGFRKKVNDEKSV